MIIKLANSDLEINNCFNVLSELRPHLLRDSFLTTVQKLSKENNFKLAYLDDNGVKAVAGLRIGEWLYNGIYLEIEDLVTSEGERSKNYGGKLFDWLCNYALENNCKQLRLVSGVNRESAHRFYLAKGMKYEAKYFSLDLKETK